MAGDAVRRRRHPHHRRRDPGRHRRRSCARLLARLVAEMRAQGTTTVEIKSGYGLTVARRGPRAAARPRVHRRDDVPRRARRARRSTPTTATATSTWSPARCSTPARRTPGGSTCSASRRAHAFDDDQARRCSPPGAAPGSGCGCTATSSAPGPGVRLAVELGRGQRRPLHLPHRRRRRRAGAAAGTTVATLLPGRRVLDPVALPGRPPAARRRRHGRAGDRLQPGLLLHLVDAVRASRSPSARCG